jgi:hypothetical protein
MRVSDLEITFLEKHLSLIDAQLDVIADDAKKVGDPDMFGHLDDAESLTGLGFVACQRFQTAVYPHQKATKDAALSVGPSHDSGLTIAQIVNHAANYWKHEDEWRHESPTKQQQRTRAAIELLNGGATDYPLSCVLAEITGGDYHFCRLLPQLTIWYEQLCTTAERLTNRSSQPLTGA